MTATSGALRRGNRTLRRAVDLLLALGLATACSTTAPPAQPTAPAGWLAAAQRHIAEREYRASENGAGLQAPNRAQNLRTYFDAHGIRVHDRTAADSPELLRLSLAGVGRGESIAAAAPGEGVVAHENRVEIRRPGIVEWYENSPAGLEQGFTLDERPAGDGPLVLELSVVGGKPALRGGAVVFRTAAGRQLDYGALAAADARGRTLATQFDLPGGDRLRIVVDDHAATYPIAIDPLLQTGRGPDARLESNQEGAGAGFSVAGAGDVNGDSYDDVIVGAPFYDAGQQGEGAAFVYLGSASGIADGSPATAVTQFESDQAGAQLGISVSSAGDVNGDDFADVIVGARHYLTGTFEGAAFVFHGSASGIAHGNPLTAAARLTSDQGSPVGLNPLFGAAVAGAGDVNGDGYDDVIVGAETYDSGEADEGAAFVFLGSASGIADANPATAATRLESNQARPAPPAFDPPCAFGRSVAGADDVNGDGYDDVIVGAPHYVGLGGGAAFVFLGSASGITDADPSTASTQLGSSAFFGGSVAGAGDVNDDGYADVIVGQDSFGNGLAFVFLGSSAGIASGTSTTAAAQLASGQPDAKFGASVAGAGDTNGDGYDDVIVGAPNYHTDTTEGVAFVFFGNATGIASSSFELAPAKLEAPPGYELGLSVAGAGDVNGDGYADLIAGDYNYDAAQQFEGAAFVFLGSASIASPPVRDAHIESNEASARLGFSVASAGDVNDDGFGDIIVGAPYFDSGQTSEGAAFVFHGSAAGIANGTPATAATQLESDLAFANLGESVSGAGDVDHDGFDDVIAGAPSYETGAAFVFLGSATGVADGNPASAATRLEADPAGTCPPTGGNAGFGVSIAAAGDVNGDDYGDVIVGAPHYPPCSSLSGIVGAGAAFVFVGSANGIADATALTAATRLSSADPRAWLGNSVASAGDVNGDGFDDVIVGAPNYSTVESDEGVAFVFHGSALGIIDASSATAAAQLESNQPFAGLGSSVAGAGDVDDDGYDDVIVGAPSYDQVPESDSNDGAAFVFLGTAAGIASGNPATAATQLLSDQDHASFGVAVAGAGDVDRDGRDDVIVGASRYGTGEGGAAFVFLGDAGGIADASAAAAAARIESDQNLARLGASVAGAGDVNGDGADDVIVGAPLYDDGEIDEGAVFVALPEPTLRLAFASGLALLAALRRRRLA